MPNLDALRELYFADCDPQFMPDPEDMNDEYLKNMSDLYEELENFEINLHSVSSEYRTSKLIRAEALIREVKDIIESEL